MRVTKLVRRFKLQKNGGEWLATLPSKTVINITTGEGASYIIDKELRERFLNDAKAYAILMDMQDIQNSGEEWLKSYIPENPIMKEPVRNRAYAPCILHLGRWAKAYVQL